MVRRAADFSPANKFDSFLNLQYNMRVRYRNYILPSIMERAYDTA
jgi:hypothetical protein